MRYRFERAESDSRFEQIFRFTNDVFARELHQYAPEDSGRKVDKFHNKNVYFVALEGDELVGIIALHDKPPFSIAEKLSDPSILNDYGKLLEVRLLAVAPQHRRGNIMAGLMLATYEYARQYDAIAISGITTQARIYHSLGFRDLGPPVRSGEAWFIPMLVPVRELAIRQARWRERFSI